MAEPISPVLVQGLHPDEKIVEGPDGADVNPCPVLATNQGYLVRWRLARAERAMAAMQGDIWVFFRCERLPVHLVMSLPPVIDAQGNLQLSGVDPLEELASIGQTPPAVMMVNMYRETAKVEETETPRQKYLTVEVKLPAESFSAGQEVEVFVRTPSPAEPTHPTQADGTL